MIIILLSYIFILFRLVGQCRDSVWVEILLPLLKGLLHARMESLCPRFGDSDIFPLMICYTYKCYNFFLGVLWPATALDSPTSKILSKMYKLLSMLYMYVALSLIYKLMIIVTVTYQILLLFSYSTPKFCVYN